MKISVKARPGAKRAYVEEMDGGVFTVAVTEPPVDGRANDAVMKALAAHFGVAQARVRMISGHTSKNKIVEIL